LNRAGNYAEITFIDLAAPGAASRKKKQTQLLWLR
jgi:hypothetical protein